MELTPQDYDRFYRASRKRERPSHLVRFARYWSGVAVLVLSIYGATNLVLSIESTIAPEQKKAADPIAEKLTMPRSLVIACDATMTNRGAQQKWTPPECYVHPEPRALTTKASP